MGVPIPPGTLAKMQHPWPGEEDYGAVSDADRMAMQDNAYHGRFIKPLKPTDEDAPDFNVLVNRCEPIVATGIDFLIGDEIKFEVVDDQDNPQEEAQQYLDDAWEANVKMPLIAEYEINSGMFGHAFYKLIPDDDDMPTDDQGKPYPALVVLNPQQMRVRTFPTDVRKVARFAFTYPDVNEQGDAVLARQLTQRDGKAWVIRDQIHVGGGNPVDIASAISLADQLALGDEDRGWEDVNTTNWEFPWAPIHDSKNLPEPNQYLGKADLRLDIIHLNDVLNFLESNGHRAIYYSGHPKDFLFGVTGRGDLDVTPGNLICIPNINARIEHVEMVGALDAIENAIKRTRDNMDELSHVPAVAVGRQEHVAPVSGVALKVQYRPLMSQTMQKRNLRAAMYKRLCLHMLELKRPAWAKLKILVQWPNMVPADDLIAAQTAQIYSGLGVSNDTLMQRAPDPFDPDVEREKKQQEADAALAQQQKSMAALGPPTNPDGSPADQPPSGPTPPGQGNEQGNPMGNGKPRNAKATNRAAKKAAPK